MIIIEYYRLLGSTKDYCRLLRTTRTLRFTSLHSAIEVEVISILASETESSAVLLDNDDRVSTHARPGANCAPARWRDKRRSKHGRPTRNVLHRRTHPLHGPFTCSDSKHEQNHYSLSISFEEDDQLPNRRTPHCRQRLLRCSVTEGQIIHSGDISNGRRRSRFRGHVLIEVGCRSIQLLLRLILFLAAYASTSRPMSFQMLMFRWFELSKPVSSMNLITNVCCCSPCLSFPCLHHAHVAFLMWKRPFQRSPRRLSSLPTPPSETISELIAACKTGHANAR